MKKMLCIPPPPPPPLPPPTPSTSISSKMAHQPKYKLPFLNWTPLDQREASGTLFDQFEPKHLRLDFDDFEKIFHIGSNQADDATPSKRFKCSDQISLLSHSRLRNLAIIRRKLGLPIQVVIDAINGLNMEIFTEEKLESLQKMLPTDTESELYLNYPESPALLGVEDQFLFHLSRVERISSKIGAMSFMIGFDEVSSLIQFRVDTIMIASTSLQNCNKLHELLKLILAFGNLMNSRGIPAAGFRIQSLECLNDIKSTDRSQTLLNFIANLVQTRFTSLGGILDELDLGSLERASQFTFEDIREDLEDLEKGLELLRKEAGTSILTYESKISFLRSEFQDAFARFVKCLEFFGEKGGQIEKSRFFANVLKFLRAYEKAGVENEERRRSMTYRRKYNSFPGSFQIRGTTSMEMSQIRSRNSVKTLDSDPESMDLESLLNGSRNGRGMGNFQRLRRKKAGTISEIP